ncbi:hypothetical protein YC2023_037521 [Brassica napus]
MNKWKYYFVNIWQCYFSVWFQSQKVNINQLSKDNLEFLGYLSSLRLNPLVVRSQMLENSFLIDNVRIKLDSNIPISSIIRSLAKEKFCNVLGHPISKATWTDSSDSDILNRFLRICRNISHYYSGSSNKKNLLGSGLLEEFLTGEDQVLSLIFPRSDYASKRLYRVRKAVCNEKCKQSLGRDFLPFFHFNKEIIYSIRLVPGSSPGQLTMDHIHMNLK